MFVKRSLHTRAHRHFQMVEVLWSWAALPQLMRSRHRQNDVFISSRGRQDEGRMEWSGGEGRWGQTLNQGRRIERSFRREEVRGCKRNREMCTTGERDNEKEWKWMTNDEEAKRRQRRGGSRPVNQIMNHSFDRELLWPETWRITFTPTRIHTFTDALSIVSQLHGDKCVSLASSLVLSARIRAYQHSCMCSVCVCVCLRVTEWMSNEWVMDGR